MKLPCYADGTLHNFSRRGGKGESYFEMMYILGTTVELNDEMCHKDRSGNSSDDDD